MVICINHLRVQLTLILRSKSRIRLQLPQWQVKILGSTELPLDATLQLRCCGHSFCGNCVDRLIADARTTGSRGDNYLEMIREVNNRLELERLQIFQPPDMLLPPHRQRDYGGLAGRYFHRDPSDELPAQRQVMGSNMNCGEVIKCPECRRPTRVPPEGLPINYRLQDLLSRVTESAEQLMEYQPSDELCRRRCLACDDVLNKGVYLSCRTCTGDETARQLCSMCCLRHHNGHEIEEKLLLTMKDVLAAKDTISEATSQGYHFLDMTLHDFDAFTEKSKELIQDKAQCLLLRFGDVAARVHFKKLSNSDELTEIVATALEIRDRLGSLQQALKRVTDEFYDNILTTMKDFTTSEEKNDRPDAVLNYSLQQLQNDAPGPSNFSCDVEADTMQDTGSNNHRICPTSKDQAAIDKRHRRTQNLRARKRRAILDLCKPSFLQSRDYLLEQWRNDFLNGDESRRFRRSRDDAPKSLSELLGHAAPAEVATQPAVRDLEQRAERLIISPQRRLETRMSPNLREHDVQNAVVKSKVRRGMVLFGNSEGKNIDPAGAAMSKIRLASGSSAYSVLEQIQPATMTGVECLPGPSSNYVAHGKGSGSISSIGSSEKDHSMLIRVVFPSVQTAKLLIWKRGCSTGTSKICSQLAPLSKIPRSELGHSILLCKETNPRGSGNSTHDIISKGVLAAKVLSLSSSVVGIVMVPVLSSYLWEAAAERPAMMMFAIVANTFLVLLSFTPLLLHFLAKRFPVNIYYNHHTKVFTSVHYNFFLRKMALQFKANEVVDAQVAPEMSKVWIPLATAFVHNKPLLISLDRNAYVDKVAFDEMTVNINIPSNHD
ncbi:hypothetical protein Q1695_001744 [Nippostrongylus brasiliensis]|nr:hypothetical protein Q1695_001744 [Nippostrongylus brasiliensis]